MVKHYLFFILLLLSCNSCKNQQHSTSMNDTNLKQALEAKKADYAEKWSDATLSLHENGIKEVATTGITGQALQVGDKAIDFTLTNHLDKAINLSEVLENGPVVLTWYRGGWCPYCNLTLHALQNVLPEIKAEGATLLALTPEVPDQSLSTAKKHNLEFEVLTDLHNQVGKQFGIVFKLEKNVAAVYQNGFDLHAYNGDDSDELPLAATYVIDTNGIIKWAFLDADYRNRAEPSEIIKQLKKL